MKLHAVLMAWALFGIGGCGHGPTEPVAPQAQTGRQKLPNSVATPASAATKPQATLLTDVRVQRLPEETSEFVDPRSGMMSTGAVDMALQAGPVALEIERRLLPPVEADAASYSGSVASGLLGARWRLNWESRLIHAGTMAVIEESRGATVFVREDETPNFRSGSGEFLELQSDGAIRRNPDGSSERYDASGRLVSRDERNGNQIKLTYGANGWLERIDGPFQSWLRLTTVAGRLMRIESSAGDRVEYGYEGHPLPVGPGLTTHYEYTPSGRLTAVEHPQSGVRKFSYDQQGRLTRRTWADGSGERYQYDEDGQGVTLTDSAGGVTRSRWSDGGRQCEIVDSTRQKSVVRTDTVGRPLEVTGPTGKTAKITYDDLGRTNSVEHPVDGRTTFEYLNDTQWVKGVQGPGARKNSFEYDDRFNLTATRGSAACGLTMEYYGNGLVKSVDSCQGVRQSFEYDANGRLTTRTNSAGQTWRYQYDAQGNLITEEDPAGGVTTRTYDATGQLATVRNPSGGTTRVQYTPLGQISAIIDANDGVNRLEYDARGRLTAETDPAGRKTVYRYDGAGRLAEYGNAGGMYRYEYNGLGKLLREINPLGSVVTRTFDPIGQLLTETAADGGQTRYEYAPDGRTAKAIDGESRSSTLQYDEQRRVVAETDATGQVTRYQYTPQGAISTIVLPTGVKLGFEYDDAANVTTISRDGKVLYTYKYDMLGQRTAETHSTGLEQSFRYDAVGNLVSWKDNTGDGASMQYNPAGQLLVSKNALGAASAYRYDLSGRLLSVQNPLGKATLFKYSQTGELAGVTSPSGDGLQYHYDSAGRLETIEHASGGGTHFEFDAVGNPLQMTDPQGAKTVWTYDAVGRMLSSTDAKGQTTRLSYDTAGRVLQKHLADGTVIRYEYDLAGHLLSADDGVFPVRYAYNAAGLRTAIEYPAIQRKMTYAYDNQGQMTEWVNSEGQKIGYSYDDAGRLSGMQLDGKPAVDFTYDAKDRLIAMNYGNGVRGMWKYDAIGQLTSVAYGQRGQKQFLAAWRHAYDAAGNCVETLDEQSRPTKLQYDSASQLVEEARGDAKTRYAYLPGGNRGERTAGDLKEVYRYEAGDRLVQRGEESFVYDANGNLSERRGPAGVTRYAYDGEDRLIEVAKPDGAATKFGYAPTGERVWQRDGEHLTYFVTDGLHVTAELDGDLKPQATYVHGQNIDNPLVMKKGNQLHYLHADALGSVAALTDGQGKRVSLVRYDAFGHAVERQGEVACRFGYTGREFDSATGLYYYRARYYDPTLGRFLTRDTRPGSLYDPVALNAYAYTLNNPLRHTDPMGTTAHPLGSVGPMDSLGADAPNPILNQFPYRDEFGVTHPNVGGTYSPYKGIDAYPGAYRGTVPPEKLGSIIVHEQHHWKQWQMKMDQMRLQPGGVDVSKLPVDEQQKLFQKWISEPGVKGLLERGAYWQQAQNLVRDRGLSPSDPEVQKVINMYRHPGAGNASWLQTQELKQALDRIRPPAVSVTGVAGGLGTAFKGSAIGIDLAACIAEGKSEYECGKELGTSLGYLGGAVLLGKGIGAVVAGTAAGTVLTAAAPVLAVAGAIAGGTKLIKAGNRWADAPVVKAQAEQQAQIAANKKFLLGIVSAFEAKVNALNNLTIKIQAARDRASAEFQTAIEAEKTAAGLLATISKGQPSADLSNTAAELLKQIEAYAAKAEEHETLLEQGLDLADEWAGHISSQADADRIVEAYANGKGLTAGIVAEAAKAKSRNEQLNTILAQFAAAKAAGPASDVVAQISAESARCTSAVAAGQAEIKTSGTDVRDFEHQGIAIREEIQSIRARLPLDDAMVDEAFADIHAMLQGVVDWRPIGDVAGGLSNSQAALARIAQIEARAKALESGQSANSFDGITSGDAATERADTAATLAVARLAASASSLAAAQAWTPPTDPASTTSKEVVVPKAIGMTVDEGTAVFGDDFSVAYAIEGAVPPGSEDKLRVYSQEPPAGSTRFKSDDLHPISVLLSLTIGGKDPSVAKAGGQPDDPTTPTADTGLPVPSAIGMSVTEAYGLISKDFVADFKSDDEQTLPADNAEDKMRVISQSPVPYEIQPKGTKVMMIIRHLEKGVVPDVTGLSKQMASQRVAGAGLKPAFSFTEGFVEEGDPGLASMRVTAQTPSAGTKIQGEGEVAMVLTRSDAGTTSNAEQPKPPTETTPDTPPSDETNQPTVPLELGGAWTGELVVTDVTDTPPEGCDVSLLEKGKPFPMAMAVGAPNEQGKGKLSVGGTQNGQKQESNMPFSYNPKDGTISFSQSQNGMKIIFDGRCTKSENGNVMEGTFSVEQGGQTIFGGKWKQTKKTP